MVLFNYSTRELTAKIVYYGPGLCGKTSNLQYIYENLPQDVSRGKMLSLATKTDRTLFFDFLPIDLGTIRGMKTRIQLYTVPGQVFYNSTRKMVLKGADGVVFVADSQAKMIDANIESFANLEENLAEQGMRLDQMPLVLQFNKRDLPNLASIEELNSQLNKYNAPFYEAIVISGIGVHDTLKAATKLVLNSLTNKYRLEKPEASKATAQPAAPAATPPATAQPAAPAATPPAAAQPAAQAATPPAAAAAPPLASEPAPQPPVAAPVAIAQEEPDAEVLELVEDGGDENILEIVEELAAPDTGSTTMRLSAASGPLDPNSKAARPPLEPDPGLDELEIVPLQGAGEPAASIPSVPVSPAEAVNEIPPELGEPRAQNPATDQTVEPIVLKVQPGESPIVNVPLKINYGNRTLEYRLQIHLQALDEH